MQIVARNMLIVGTVAVLVIGLAEFASPFILFASKKDLAMASEHLSERRDLQRGPSNIDCTMTRGVLLLFHHEPRLL